MISMEAVPKDRQFYSIPKNEKYIDLAESQNTERQALIKYISDNIIGNNKVFSGPFGLRKVTYLDYIASGRGLKFIEDYIQNEVLPDYGNTHTTTSITSLQTTLYRHEARDVVRNAVHASEHDSVIFCGSGSTAAVHKLIHALSLDKPPVVFVSPYEHHSTLLPWREVGAKVVRIKQDTAGHVCLSDLGTKLQKWQTSGRQLIGCFSAASNITGMMVDVDAVTVCLHRHDALAFWDYATAAPYVKIDMNPVNTSDDQPYIYKDAIFISPHKFVGGVSTPGILVAKKSLFRNMIPEKCGGGSVFFVRRDGHRYLQEPELKEEGGTPAIVESIRAGLVFQLKEAVTAETIMEREHELYRRARDAWKDCDNLVLLGNLDSDNRLPVFSFLVHQPTGGRFLHYNFVASVLNDVFGIQARGGCACAGPYAMDLLGLDEVTATEIELLLAEDHRLDRTHLRRYREYSPREIIRPGFVRINLPYFIQEDTLQFVLEAIRLTAEHSWKLLPQYMFNPETGEWRQKNFQVFKDRKWLGHIRYKSGEMKYKVPPYVVKGPLPSDYQDCLQKAQDLFKQAERTRYQLADHTQMFDDKSHKYRWFMVPSEAAACLQGNVARVRDEGFVLPFCPPALRERVSLPPFIAGGRSDEWESLVKDTGDCRTATPANQDLCSQSCFEGHTVERPFSDGMIRSLDRGFHTDNESAGGGDLKVGVKGTTPEDSGEGTMKTAPGDIREGLKQTHPMDVRDDSGTRVKPCIPELVNSDNSSVCRTNISARPTNDNSGCQTNSCAQTINSDGIECRTKACTRVCRTTQGGCVVDKQTCGQNTSSRSSVEGEETQTQISGVSGEKQDTNIVCVKSVNMSKQKTNKGAKDECSESDGCAEVKRQRMQVPSDTGGGTDAGTGLHVSMDTSDVNNSMDNIVGQGSENTKDKSNKRLEKKKKNKSGWFSPPKVIFTPFLKAVEDYTMIEDGDRVLVGLSGGKDSLSLLHTLHQYQFYCRSKGVRFEVGAVTVDPQTPSYDPSPLKAYLASLGVPYFYESQCIMETAQNLDECASICSFCSRMKRGRIYACARQNKYNVLALGQHLDDLSESFLMSVFHNGLLRTMKAHYTVDKGDLRVIRPLVYVREKDLRLFAEQNKLPVIAENCPACFESPKERHRIKQLLAAQEILFPHLFHSLMAALKPLMAINKTGIQIAEMLKLDQASQEDEDM